jgi:RimJ/RimL family protein N-acetyltransferase
VLNPYLHAALGEQHAAMLRADSAAARQARLARLARSRGRNRLVRLRDGSAVLINPVRSADAPLLAEGFERLSAKSRLTRFLSPKKQLSARELRYFTEIDHHNHEALGAISVEDGRGVGIARYVRDTDDPQAAEIAVTIVDEWQGRGLGTLLLTQLTKRARQEGISRFNALIADGNEPVLALLRRTSSELRPVRREPGAMFYHVIPLGEETAAADAEPAATACSPAA